MSRTDRMPRVRWTCDACRVAGRCTRVRMAGARCAVHAAVPPLHPDAWRALRRVARGEAPGSPELREVLFRRRLAEWIPGESGVRLTALGRAELER